MKKVMEETKTWADRLSDAAERKHTHLSPPYFTDDDMYAADHWGSCAVGEGLKFKENKEPKSSTTLTRLGVAFMWAVKEDAVTTASSLYECIQQHIRRYVHKGKRS